MPLTVRKKNVFTSEREQRDDEEQKERRNSENEKKIISHLYRYLQHTRRRVSHIT